MRVGPGVAGAEIGIARTDGASCSDGQKVFSWNPGPLDSSAKRHLEEGAQKPYFCFEVKRHWYRSVECLAKMLKIVVG